MTRPDLTAEKPVREQLQELFEQMAQRSFEFALINLNKVNFFDEVIRRVSSGQDIAEDIPEAKQLSQVDLIAVVKQQRQLTAEAAISAWELSTTLASNFRTTVRSEDVAGELIPRFDAEHVAVTEAGQVRIGINTWRRNIEVKVVGSDESISALIGQMAMLALIQTNI